VADARITWVDHERHAHDHWLAPADGPVLVGRAPTCQLRISDPAVSRKHVLLTPVHDTWIAEDLSHGVGTQLERGGQRLALRQRQALSDGDRLHIGGTVLAFKDAGQPSLDETRPGGLGERIDLREREQDVLNVLCRRVIDNAGPPASNTEIAAELFLSVEGVRSNLKSLYRKFGIDSGTPDQRRAVLVQRAIDEVYISLT
jgi:DNA-binding CsgD family transcriptional regulator